MELGKTDYKADAQRELECFMVCCKYAPLA
jgi:hypothetical protein